MNSTRDVSEQALMLEMGLTAENIERRKRDVGLGPADLTGIGKLTELVREHAEEFTSVFFDSLRALDETKLLASRELLERARRQE